MSETDIFARFCPMAKTFEEVLRRAMFVLGQLVEALIGKARQARTQVGSRGGVQPVLSLENQLSFARIRGLIDAATQKAIADAIPDLKGGMALEVGEGPVLYGARLLVCQAKKVVGVEIGGGSVGRQGDISRGYVVRGDVAHLPFGSGRFNYVLARLATVFQGDVTRAIREVGRVLARGGQGLIIDYHPFGLYATRGTTRLRPAESGVHRLEDYYHICKQAGVRVVDVREAMIDEGVRGLFEEGEIHVYRGLKGTPLLIFLFVYRPKGTGG